jgi:hypothetical protein
MSGYPPSIELTRLYERTSERGTRYMVGAIGGVKMVLLPGNAAEDGTPTWRLLLQQRAMPNAAPGVSRPRQRQGPKAGPAVSGQPFDDPPPDVLR